MCAETVAYSSVELPVMLVKFSVVIFYSLLYTYIHVIELNLHSIAACAAVVDGRVL